MQLLTRNIFPVCPLTCNALYGGRCGLNAGCVPLGVFCCASLLIRGLAPPPFLPPSLHV